MVSTSVLFTITIFPFTANILMEISVPTILGNKIKTLRKDKKLTLEELAMLTESSKSYIWEIENKDETSPSTKKLALIAKALDVTVSYLIDDDQTQISDELTKDVFYRKLGQLDKDDQKKIMDMIDMWGKK